MNSLRIVEDYIGNPPSSVDYVRVIYDAKGDKIYFESPIQSLYESIDLGLSVNWATCNVGATKPEEYGLYFAWGETEGYSGVTDNKGFYWGDYKFTTAATGVTDASFRGGLTKYNTNSASGTVDNLITLELVDDAAYISDNTCRMPTSGECQELITNTTSAWTSVNGVNGIQLTSKVEGYTDKSIFIPAAGYVSHGSLRGVGSHGFIWSSSLNSGNPRVAHSVFFYSGSVLMGSDYRYYGFSVRPVFKN